MTRKVLGALPEPKRARLGAYLEKLRFGTPTDPEDDRAMNDLMAGAIRQLPEEEKRRLQGAIERAIGRDGGAVGGAVAGRSFPADREQMERCHAFTDLVAETFARGGTVFTCGNGGSHCDALHFAEECTGRFRKARRPLGALALGEAALVTCVGNDFGFDHVFARQVEALGRAGDALVAISTSGQARNLALAVEAAKAKGLRTVGLLGRGGGPLAELVELAIVVPGETTDRIQELHITLVHTVIEAVERRLFPDDYR